MSELAEKLVVAIIPALIGAASSIIVAYIARGVVKGRGSPDAAASPEVSNQQIAVRAEVFSLPIAILLPVVALTLFWLVIHPSSRTIDEVGRIVIITTCLVYAYSVLRHLVLIRRLKDTSARRSLWANLMICTVCLLPLAIISGF